MSATPSTSPTKPHVAPASLENRALAQVAELPTSAQNGQAFPGVDHELIRVLRDDGSLDPTWNPGLGDDRVLELYRAMVRTRIVDERLVALQRQGRIGFHIGSLGEEATILGSAAAARPQDWIFPCYREFGALLLRGLPLQSYLHNMFGNAKDPARGRQMPDHYTGRAYHFGSVSSPIGTQITQAVGFAWAAKMRKDELVTLVYFGEGATSSSEFHNGLNFGGVFKTPTVFLCRNNGWAISVPASKQSASSTFADKAVAYGIRGVRVDGNDLLAVYRATRDAIERASRGDGPTLVEMMTYRLSGHSTSDDPKAYRGEHDVEPWRARDPIARLRRHLESKRLWDDAKQKGLDDTTEAELRDCITTAEQSPAPSLESLFDDVYAELPQHLVEQRDRLLAGPRAKGHGH